MLSTAIASMYSALAAQPAPTMGLEPEKVEPTTLDTIGAVLALGTLTLCGIALLGMGVWMIYKALTQPQSLQTSWGPAQEAQFEPYATVETRIHNKSWMIAFVSAAVVGVLAVALYFGVTPEPETAGESMDMSTFDRKTKAPAPAK